MSPPSRSSTLEECEGIGCIIGSSVDLGGPFAAYSCDPGFRITRIGFFGVVRDVEVAVVVEVVRVVGVVRAMEYARLPRHASSASHSTV